MLTLSQIQALHNEIMFDECVLHAAAQIIDEHDVEERIEIAQMIAQMTIITTFDKLSKMISEIPSAKDLEHQIIEETVSQFLATLD